MDEHLLSGTRALRPRARLLRTLGSDLISSEKVALIELVKNSFDADAGIVLIRFHGPLVEGCGRVEILDDGHGMDVETLQTSWLDIATDMKKKRTRSESGARRVLGEKGIGRLAASRLGSEMLLVTRRAHHDEINLLIDWTQFDRDDTYLDEIEVAWHVGNPTIFAPSGIGSKAFADCPIPEWTDGRGTLLQIDKLTRAWTEEDFLDLRTALSRLIRPVPSSSTGNAASDFKIVLELPPGHESLSGEVGPPEELDTPHYKLSGTVDGRGVAQLRYLQVNPPVEKVLPDVQLWNDDARQPQSGAFEIDVEVWDRDAEAIRKVSAGGSVRDFRRLLDQVAGVSVYRDGFRVLPFGEVGDDWLGLDRRRVQNPTLRLSNNQVIGHVFIGADANADLRDQSNREGLLDGNAYDDLQKMIHGALTIIESRRYSARRPEKPKNESRSGLFQRFELDELRKVLATKYAGDRQVLELIDAKNREIQEGVDEVQRILSQYSRLATLGTLIDRVLHDGRTSVARLKSIVRFGERDLAKNSAACETRLQTAQSSLQETSIQANLLSTLFNQIEPFGGRKRGRPKTVSLNSIVNNAIAIFRTEADEKGVVFEFNDVDIDVTVDQSEVLTVLVNLLQNSLHWISNTPKSHQRKIHLTTKKNSDQSVSIIVSDTGPGVPDHLRDAIFDAYFSNRRDGVGLGLSIAGNIVQDLYQGQLSLLESGPLRGATFEAVLRKRV